MEAVRQFLDAVGRHDRVSIEACLAEDGFSMVSPAGRFDRDSYVAFLRSALPVFEDHRLDVRRLVGCSDGAVLAQCEESMRIGGDPQVYRWASIFELAGEDGPIRSARTDLDVSAE